LDIRKSHPYSSYEDFDFEVPFGTVGDSYDRYLVRMEEMRQSVRILQQAVDNLPDGPVNSPDAKSCLPNKESVLTKMEELIHHFINVTEGVNAPPGEIYFSAENPKGELGFYIVSKGGGTPHRLKIRAPVLREFAGAAGDGQGPHDERHGHRPRQHRFRDGECDR